MNTEQTKQFIDNSRYAIDHLFAAINEYNDILVSAQNDVEKFKESQKILSDVFMYRDQWSPNANFYYAQYIERAKQLKASQSKAQEDIPQKIDAALANIGATIDSMSSLAGAILQIAKQVLGLRHNGKPNMVSSRNIGSQGIIEIIWEGRNHAMHWDEGSPKEKVKLMLESLKKDLSLDIELGSNNCLSILGALGWTSTDEVITDLHALV
ncbi:TPA: hypothetical protein ACVU41_000254 [Vibrio parahaemolyticus]